VRDARARRTEGLTILEGARLVDGALDRDAPIVCAYVGPDAPRACPGVVGRLRAAGVPVRETVAGVIERVASTQTPQPVVAVARAGGIPLDALARDGLLLVAVDLADPGNAGTLLRSAEAAGVVGVVFSGNSVDPFGPKAVRSSAGAVFGIPVAEGEDPVDVLDALRAHGRRRLATVTRGGERYEGVDLTEPIALVLGGEAHGIRPAVRAHVDGELTVPMAGDAESLNVAVAGAVVAFEAARQRRARTGTKRSSAARSRPSESETDPEDGRP
jgi:TrmH family RNA methyltransferase